MNDDTFHERPYQKIFNELAQKAKALGALGLITVFITPLEDQKVPGMVHNALHVEFTGHELLTKEGYIAVLETAVKIMEATEYTSALENSPPSSLN